MSFPNTDDFRSGIVGKVRAAARRAGSLRAVSLGLALLAPSLPVSAEAQDARAPMVSPSERPALPGLVDGHGAPYDPWDDAKGWRLMYFGFTNCPNICPTSLFEMAAALDLVAPKIRSKITPVFATVDPARDTPAVMSRYVVPLTYTFTTLTGPIETMDKLAWTYKIITARPKTTDGQPYSVDHSSIVLLLDPSGAAVERFAYAVTYQEVARRVEARVRGTPVPPA
ncbi:hypothetical protein ASG43_06150 [Aureimonas sp. Leaf454]|uniref:SCO family protein n=1 Tax=Aureimonas sp. Leaf454 TaxID=1736381 RepID=UPI0007012597|nr:SCO family protein [Aureimonas sp. Leaf454]KQT50841.1 hypothetical protein ASG43_06150 [Aureimonas sp. Leaf454]